MFTHILLQTNTNTRFFFSLSLYFTPRRHRNRVDFVSVFYTVNNTATTCFDFGIRIFIVFRRRKIRYVSAGIVTTVTYI